MQKEIANKVKKEIYIKCKKCADKIFGDTRKKMTYCKCKTIGVDGCEDYIRVIGNEGDYETIKMRKKRNPKFKVEVIYKEVPDKKDRVRQLWDVLVFLPDPDRAPKESEKQSQ